MRPSNLVKTAKFVYHEMIIEHEMKKKQKNKKTKKIFLVRPEIKPNMPQ